MSLCLGRREACCVREAGVCEQGRAVGRLVGCVISGCRLLQAEGRAVTESSDGAGAGRVTLEVRLLHKTVTTPVAHNMATATQYRTAR
jgi:hypothetical protein